MKRLCNYILLFLIGFCVSTLSGNAQTEYTFSYTGSYQEFIVPTTGYYKLEVWGAKGGDYNSTYIGGNGGYSSGEVLLMKGQKLYVFVGEQGKNNSTVSVPATFNGGGSNRNASVNVASGGGATDIRLAIDDAGSWDNAESLLSRFIVAGGGGSGGYNGTHGAAGGAGGGLSGITGGSTNYSSSYEPGDGGTQTEGGSSHSTGNESGSFGKGGNSNSTSLRSGAGGGGWYGGGAGAGGGVGGGGGSGFVLTSESIANVPEGYSVTEKYYLTNATTIAGNESIPTFDGEGTMTGNSGDGYAKITFLRSDIEIEIIGIDDYGFEPSIHEYDIYVTKDTLVNIDIVEKMDDYTYFGLGSTTFRAGDTHYVSILSPDGELEIYRYTIKEKTLNVDSISFDEVSFDFDPSIYEYNLEVTNDITKLTPNVVSNGTYTVSGNNQLKVGENKVTITITNSDTSADYNFNVNRASADASSATSTTFEYTGGYQEYTVPTTGYYKLEVWGAKGGDQNSTAIGGNGGYSSGVVLLNEGQKLYVFVGEQGKTGASANVPGTFNGGGSNQYIGAVNVASGGGATDIRLAIDGTGSWDNEESLLSRFIVAGGGGAGGRSDTTSYYGIGGAGGGLSGIAGTRNRSSYSPGDGGTQTAGGSSHSTAKGDGSFGKGGNANHSSLRSGAGGGGWYGGGSGSGGGAGGGGGSGFVLTSESIANAPEGYSVTEDFYLQNAVTIAGNESIPTFDGASTMTGNSGDGYAKITYVGEMGIDELILSSGELTPEFANDTYEYTLELESDVYELDVDAILANSNDSITGLGTYMVPDEGIDITLTVTRTTGIVTVYTIHVERPSSIISFLDNILVNGVSIEGFSPYQYNYVVEVPYYLNKINVEAIPFSPYQEVSYENSFTFDEESVVKTILSISESGTENQLYTVTFNREQTTFLKSLELSNNVSIDFKPDVFEYNVEIYKDLYELDVEYSTYNESAQVEVTGTGFLKDDPDPIVITVTNGDLPPSTYTIHLTRSDDVEFSEDYIYTGDYQVFTAPTSGYYKLETWGAEGGSYNTKYTGGKGGYAAGTVKLQAGQQLYIYVGGQGDLGTGARPGGYNGGGNSSGRTNYKTASGGGATDIRLVSGTWSDQTSLLSRLIVAGGGGAGSFNGTYSGVGGAGGGASGLAGTSTYSSSSGGKGGTQTAGGTRKSCSNNQPGSFGKGGNAATVTNDCMAGAGGGGWYGGGSGYSNGAAGGGGSGFVLTSTTASSTPEGYSVTKDFYLTETTNLAGNQTIPNYDGTGTMTGNSGDGHAKITLLETVSSVNYLNNLLVDGESVEDFEPNKMEYTVNLTKEQFEVDITAVPKDNNAMISGVGKTFIPAGRYEHSVLVTATDGSVRTYKINFIREANDNAIPNDIRIKGMISALCKMDASYCVYTFDVNTTEYNITLPIAITDIEIVPDIEADQKVEYYLDDEPLENGEIVLENTSAKVEVKIIAENGVDSKSYIYNFTKDDRANSYLKSITITNPDIEFEFDKMVYEYYLEIDGSYSSYDIEAIPESSASHVMINDGNKNLQAGNNDCIITVTSALGTTKNYIIHMYKSEDTNTYLESLELTDGEDHPIEFAPTFSKYLNDYSVVVESDIDEIKINATAAGVNAEVEGTGTFSLKSGLNQFVITVSSESGATLDYNLSVFRNKSSNANIDIEVVGYDIAFDPEVYDYILEVPKEVTDLEVLVTPEVDTTTYTITGNKNMNKTSNIISITSTAEDGTKKTYTIEVRKQLSTNNYLQDITLSEGELDPAFDKLTNNYRVEVSSKTDKITITGIPEDTTTRVTGNGEYSLTKGENEITLIAISEDGETNIYSVIVSKALDNDTTLKEIKNSQNSVASEIEHDDYDYVINVQYEVSSIEMEGIPNSETSVVTGNGTYRLNPGDNIITLSVQAEDGSVAYHRVNIIRDLSTNDDLQFLYVEEGGLNPRFNETTVYYEVKVPNDVNILTIEAITEDPDATYEVIGNDGLEVGVPKEIIIRVKAPKGNTKDYTLMVTRQETTSNNLDLLSLETNRGELIPTFSPSTTNYTLEVANEITDITVNATAATPDSVQVVGTGTYNLNVGKNAISVFVIGEDGIQKDYQIVVTRNKSSDASLSNLVISGSVLTPKFEKDTLEYQVSTDKDSLDFRTITPTEEEATYEVIGNENFVTGPNEVTIKVTAPDGVTTREYKVIANKAASQNNNLASLTVSGYTLYPTFNKGITYYEVDVNSNVNNVIINATPEDANAEVEGTGLKMLQTGANTYQIVVRSEADTTKTYTVVVNKALSTNNYLSILEPNYGNFNEVYDKELTEYTLTVPYDITNISFVTNPEDAEATVTKEDSYELRVGRNDINITVMSESGDIRIYHVVVTRNEVESSLLKELEINGYELTPSFRSENFEYQVDVNSETNSLDFASIVPLEEGAEYEVTGNENFVMGFNEVHIKVTSKNPEIDPTEYIIYVNKQASGSNYLEYLEVTDHELTPEFDKNVLEYDVTVASDVTSIEVLAEVEDANARITEGIGEHSLQYGLNKIKVVVKSSLGITRTYIINVTRELDNNNYLQNLEVIINNKNLIKFDKDTLTYDVMAGAEDKLVEIRAEAENTNAQVSGDGIFELVSGTLTKEVTVVSEAGEARVYRININKEVSTNNEVLNIIPSSGALEPIFNPEEHEYNLVLDENVHELSFEVTTSSTYAKVEGHELMEVPDGNSDRVIKVTSEEGIENTYTIHVIKENNSALLQELNIDGYEFAFDSNTFTYNIQVSASKKKLLESEITAIPMDDEATVNLMGDMNLSEDIINIYVIEVIAKDGYTTQEYRLNITRDSEEYTLSSDVYDIVRTDEDYVIGITQSTDLTTFKSNFNNEQEMLHVYNMEGTEEIIDVASYAGTGLILKLEKDGYVYDQVRVIVRADLTGDGRINVTDQVRLINYVGKVDELNAYEMLAADLTGDGIVNVLDQVKIINYIGRLIKDNDLNP